MKNKLFNNLSDEALILLKKTCKDVEKESLEFQKQQITKDSPYSSLINSSFSGYNEFYHLCSLGLKEATVTRKSLIRDIQPDLFVTCKQKTNYELMIEGNSPYASDDENDYIILHHIGQDYNSPFAELTFSEHSQFGNSKLLHDTKIESWRSDKDKTNAFQTEKSLYWRKRALGEFVLETNQKQKYISKGANARQRDIILKIKEPLQNIFSECSISDLKYISNLANNFILTKQIGSSSIEEFILNLREKFFDIVKCPICDKSDVCFYGYQETTNERKQRYKCKSCGHVFTLFHNTIISGCNMSFMEWLQFIDCLYNGYSLEKTAKLCNISTKSAFENRLKLFYALKILDQKVVLKGNVVIDETYIQVSYKGNRKNETSYKLTRRPHRRGHENHTPGTSKEQVCVVCALDDDGNSVARIAGLGSPTAKKLDSALKGCILKNELNFIYSDASYAINKFANINGYPIQQSAFTRKKKALTKNVWANKYIQKINSYHSRLKKFISSFNGVSTELLGGYMYLFSWKDRNRNKEPIDAYIELLSVMVTANLYKSFEQINEEKIIESAFDFEIKVGKSKSKQLKNLKKSAKIYKRFAQGEKMGDIGKTYNCSRQRIHQIIKKYREAGYAYTTEHEKSKEKQGLAMQEWQDRLSKQTQNSFKRNYEIYITKENWDGSAEEFYNEMKSKYNLSENSVKNRISEVKRVLELKKFFHVNQKYEHKTLQEMFELVYKKYKEILANNPTLSKTKCCEIIANEIGYTLKTTQNIIWKMKGNKIDWESKENIKTPLSQTINRDISVFIDLMKWTGTRKEFYEYACKEYKVSKVTLQKILQMHYMADVKRYDITKLY